MLLNSHTDQIKRKKKREIHADYGIYKNGNMIRNTSKNKKITLETKHTMYMFSWTS